MPVYTRDKLPALLKEVMTKQHSVYLLIGDRFLCRKTAGRLEKALLPGGGTIHSIDGEEEEATKTIARLRSYSLLPGRQVYRVSDTRLFHSKKIAKSLWKRVLKARADNKTESATRYLLAMMAAGGLSLDTPDGNPADLSSLEWKKCFDFAHPGGDLSWITTLLNEIDPPARQTKTTTNDDPAILLEEALNTGIPRGNLLLLLAEEVDKRKRLYKYLKKNQVIIDLSVEQGASSRAQKAQKSVLQDLVAASLTGMNKRMAGGVMEQLFDRVGFHPVAVVMETEKLCLSIGDREQITREDLDAIVGRTRQEALFELTGAIGRRQLGQAMVISTRLVDNSIHPLAIVATLRNYVRTLLLFKSLQEQVEYGYSSGMQANTFQQQCLPRLKEQERWKKELGGHPYAVFMQFKTASFLPLPMLLNWMEQILTAELRLKGSPLEPLTVLHHLLIIMLSPAENTITSPAHHDQQYR
jgi:DNA polymerase-3 subunit delta